MGALLAAACVACLASSACAQAPPRTALDVDDIDAIDDRTLAGDGDDGARAPASPPTPSAAPQTNLRDKRGATSTLEEDLARGGR